MSNLRYLPRTIRLPAVDVSRLAGPVLVAVDGAPWPPPGWELGHREPCVGGHTGDEECDLCRSVCLDQLEDA